MLRPVLEPKSLDHQSGGFLPPPLYRDLALLPQEEPVPLCHRQSAFTLHAARVPRPGQLHAEFLFI